MSFARWITHYLSPKALHVLPDHLCLSALPHADQDVCDLGSVELSGAGIAAGVPVASM